MKAFRTQAALQIRRRTWCELIAELGLRGRGTRESGAFLLGHRRSRRARVTCVVYFDDLEPGSLNGAVHLTHVAYSRLWELCRDMGLEVLGDVHTHPGPIVSQSNIDQDNPLVAQVGHVALIIPCYSQGSIRAADVGVYVYQGNDGWATRQRGLVHRRLF